MLARLWLGQAVVWLSLFLHDDLEGVFITCVDNLVAKGWWLLFGDNFLMKFSSFTPRIHGVFRFIGMTGAYLEHSLIAGMRCYKS